jgi:glycine oxidase
MLAPAGEFEEDSPLLQMSLRSLAMYPGFVAELRDETGIAIDFRTCGGLEVALSEDQEVELERRARKLSALGIASEPAKHGDHSARRYPGDAIVDPRQLTAALLVACRARGVEIREHEPILEIDRQGQWVRTASGKYEDSGVLIAAGAWSSGLFPGLRATRPIRGHLVSYRLAPGAIAGIVRNNGTYILQRSSGMVVAGSSTEEAGFNRALDEPVLADIERRVGALVPQLAGQEVRERWNGFRPGIVGEGPMIGRVPGTSVFTAFGHYRNGILLAPETARRVTDLMDGVA